MNKLYVLLIVINILLITLVQGLLKYGVQQVALPAQLTLSVDTLWPLLREAVKNPWLWSAIVVYGVALVLYLILLAKIPLSTLYAWFALTFATVPLMSAALFGDRLSGTTLTGLALIIGGIVLISRGAVAPDGSSGL